MDLAQPCVIVCIHFTEQLQTFKVQTEEIFRDWCPIVRGSLEMDRYYSADPSRSPRQCSDSSALLDREGAGGVLDNTTFGSRSSMEEPDFWSLLPAQWAPVDYWY